MAQKVLKVGSSAAVTIPKKTLEELGLKVGDEVIVETNKKKGSFTVKSNARISKKDKRIAELTLDFVERYRGDLDVLARK